MTAPTMRRRMKGRRSRILAVAAAVGLAACASGSEPPDAPAGSPATSTDASTPAPTGTDPGAQDVWTFEPFTDLEPGTYFIDPDLDPSTPMRVTFEIPVEGWQSWIGAVRFSDAGHASVSITTVANLVTHGCRDHSWADPPVGPTVDDLATALTELAPFEVTSPPEEVTAFGYPGVHVELTVPPSQSLSDDGNFIGCDEGTLKSWVAAIDADSPGDAFYGYTGPGYVEELWVLDVEGTRLLIATGRSADTPPEHLDELGAIVDHIRIEP
jgi:hypothetical protein